jgi:hypothetical protein
MKIPIRMNIPRSLELVLRANLTTEPLTDEELEAKVIATKLLFERWFKDGSITVEVDTEAETCIVLPA